MWEWKQEHRWVLNWKRERRSWIEVAEGANTKARMEGGAEVENEA